MTFNDFLFELKGKIEIEIINNYVYTGVYYSNPNEDRIVLDGKCEFIQQVLFHELAHATGNVSRLNRKAIASRRFTDKLMRDKEEFLAHMVAIALCKRFNLNSENVSKAAKQYTIGLNLDIDAVYPDIQDAYNFIMSNWLNKLTLKKVA